MAISKKQRIALELLTSGEGMSLKQVAEAAGVTPKTLWNWRNSNDFIEFQEELAKINDERWEAAVDAARAAAVRLCKADNAKFVEFVLKNVGFNPTQKVDADVNTTEFIINIEE